MPKLIAINRFYSPDHSATAQLLTDLAEDLAHKRGASVTVITSRLSYDDPTASLPPNETINGVRVRRVWTTRFGRAGLWGRALDYASFYLSASLALLIETRSGDTILAKTDPPLLSVPAAIVARLKGARLVNWCQDLFPETAAGLGLRWAAGPLGTLLRKLRNWSLESAQCNVVLCEEMRQHLLAEGVAPKTQGKLRLRVVHNWSDPAIRPLPRDRQPAEPFTICYSGNLGRAHMPERIAELIRQTADLPIRWVVIGGGAGYARLQAAAQQDALANVSFEGYAPRSELSESLARADAHLIALDPACEGLIHPSKIYGILASGRPAIFMGARDGSVAAMLARHDCGLTLDATRPETWRPALQSLIANPDRLATMARNAHAAHQRHYTQEHALAAWRDVLAPAPEPVAAPATAEPTPAKTKAAA